MKKQWRALVLSAIIWGIGVNTIYAKPMELIYDGQVHLYDEKPIHLYINDEQVETKVMPPVRIDDRVLVPAREVFEPLGAKVEWKAYEKKVYIQYENSLIVLGMNEATAWIDGENVLLDVPAKSINDKIMVPVRFISEEIGFEVQWVSDENKESREVRITASGSKEPGVEVPPVTKPDPEPTPTPDPDPDPVPEPTPEPTPDPIPPTGSGTNLKENSKLTIPNMPTQSTNYPQLGTGDRLLSSLQWVKESYTSNKKSLNQNIESDFLAPATIHNVGVLNGSVVTCYIDALSGISDVKASLEGGKLIVDIVNSKSQLSSSIEPASNPYVSKIRTSQFAADTTRVVFDLKAPVSANITLTESRLGIQIEFSPQELKGIATGEDQYGDYLVIQDIVPAQLTLKENKANNEVKISLNNATLGQNFNWSGLNQKYINNISGTTTSQGVELSVMLKNSDKIITSIKEISGHTYIRFTEPILKNATYTNTYNPVITLQKPAGLELAHMSMNDLYTQKKIVIDLGGDYSSFFKEGIMTIQDSKVNQFYMVTEGTTKLVIDEKTIQAINVYESPTTIQIELVKPKEKYKQIVVIDAGHGGTDGGSSANGIKEKEINLEQTMLIYELLEKDPNIKVYATRKEDVYPALKDRTNLANDIEADIFVSVHNNSAGATAKGTEVLYYPSTSDSRSKEMAQIVQNKIIAACGNVDRKIKARPDLVVLNSSKMPAILLEGGFLTNAEDAAKMKDPNYNQTYARAVYEGIVEIFDTLSFR